MILQRAGYCGHALERLVMDIVKSATLPVVDNIDILFEEVESSEAW